MTKLEIKEKYFNAIVCGEKDYELRHNPIDPYSLVELTCEDIGKIIFISGECKKEKEMCFIKNKWWDDFCYKYCEEKTTYAIEIKKIIKVVWFI